MPDNYRLGNKEVTQTSKYTRTYTSYSGCDIVASVNITIPGQETITRVFGSLQTFSYSIHQEKSPVRTLGDVNAITYVDGPRTIAGSMVFAVLDKHVIHEIYDEVTKKGQYVNKHYLMDELPNFDITLSFANEYGHQSTISVYNCTIIDEGQIMSINDILTENTYHYYATDIKYMDESDNYYKLNEKSIIDSNPWLTTNNAKITVNKPKSNFGEPVLELSKEGYYSFKKYMEALNKKYKKLADKFMSEKESEKMSQLKKDYYRLKKEAEDYYPSYSLLSKQQKKVRFSERRRPKINKEYDNFRTFMHTDRHNIPDYSKYRLDGKIKDSTAIPDYSKYRIDPKKDNSKVPNFDDFRKQSPKANKDIPDYSNFRKDIKTIREEENNKYKYDENGNAIFVHNETAGGDNLEHI